MINSDIGGITEIKKNIKDGKFCMICVSVGIKRDISD